MTQPMQPEPMTSAEVMKALGEHAKTLGWEIEEWNWRDESDGSASYELWIRPLDETTAKVKP